MTTKPTIRVDDVVQLDRGAHASLVIRNSSSLGPVIAKADSQCADQGFVTATHGGPALQASSGTISLGGGKPTSFSDCSVEGAVPTATVYWCRTQKSATVPLAQLRKISNG